MVVVLPHLMNFILFYQELKNLFLDDIDVNKRKQNF